MIEKQIFWWKYVKIAHKTQRLTFIGLFSQFHNLDKSLGRVAEDR